MAALTTKGNDTNIAGKMYSPCETNFDTEGMVY
jgi:hypothetical protein